MTEGESEDEEVDVTRSSSESGDSLNMECAARCEQCHELFDANSTKPAISALGVTGTFS